MENKKLILDKENIKYMLEKTLNFSTKKKQRSENSSCINDNAVSKEKTWSSEKIEDFTLKNIDTTWIEVKGVNPSVEFTKEGHMKEVEIFGNTWQDSDGKNLWNPETQRIGFILNGKFVTGDTYDGFITGDMFDVSNIDNMFLTATSNKGKLTGKSIRLNIYGKDGAFIRQNIAGIKQPINLIGIDKMCISVDFREQAPIVSELSNIKIQLEEGSEATEYEPYHKADLSDIRHVGELQDDGRYKVEVITRDKNFVSLEGEEVRTSKQTLLLPCQLSKIGDVKDRLYWDSVKGKYVIEKKIGRYDITSDEKWNISVDSSLLKDTIHYQISDCTEYVPNIHINSKIICNNFENISIYRKDIEDIHCAINKNLVVGIYKNKLKGLEKVDFKNWLKDNKTYFYYQLENPQLIETDITEQIFPSTFKDKTHFFVKGGLDGEIKGKVPVVVGKAIRTLTERNNTLKKESKNIQFINEIQEELININMLATDEIYVMLEPLLSEVETEMLNVETSSKVVLFYVAMVRKGLKTINAIPKRYKLGVMEVLANLE